MPANLENSAVATGLERSVFIPIPKKDNVNLLVTINSTKSQNGNQEVKKKLQLRAE